MPVPNFIAIHPIVVKTFWASPSLCLLDSYLSHRAKLAKYTQLCLKNPESCSTTLSAILKVFPKSPGSLNYLDKKLIFEGVTLVETGNEFSQDSYLWLECKYLRGQTGANSGRQWCIHLLSCHHYPLESRPFNTNTQQHVLEKHSFTSHYSQSGKRLNWLQSSSRVKRSELKKEHSQYHKIQHYWCQWIKNIL